eukprot:jgi/Mesen1/582/ME000107S10810
MAQLSPVFPRGKLSDVAIHKGGSLAVEDSGPPPTSATCLVADVRGIGESSAGFPSYTVEDLASDAGAILAHFYVQTPVVLDKWAAWAAKALLVWPWGPIVWSKFIATVFKQRPPDDLASYLAALQANLSEPGRLPSVAQF